MYRKSYLGIKESRPDKNFYIDVDDIENRGISQEIEKWDKSPCTKEECRYRNICRLNTLINKKEFLQNWI